MLRRKIDQYLISWKQRDKHKPLIIKGARQIGKTTSIREFGKTYESFVEINFKQNPEYKKCFINYNPTEIIKNISIYDPTFQFIPNNTLILFDEIQDFPDALTSFKFFYEQSTYDIIASGSLLGISYKKVSSIPVGFKEEYEMKSLDFEEYLWALGYDDDFIKDILSSMKRFKQLNDVIYDTLDHKYKEYMYLGGMPEVIASFVETKNYNQPLATQLRIYKDYEDDIIKYVEGLDVAKVKNIYHSITTQLSKDNHKYQISKIAHGAKSRDYIGCHEWLVDAGIINICYNLKELKTPFELYKEVDYFRCYYADHGLFMASIDKEDRNAIVKNDELDIFNGAIYESLISEALINQGYNLYFYRNASSTIELDFLIRKDNHIIPIEVKKERGRATSLINCINNPDINVSKGIKFSHQNIGRNNECVTIPYFLSFLLGRFLEEIDINEL